MTEQLTPEQETALWRLQDLMDNVSARTRDAMNAYDSAPDGSPRKRKAVEVMAALSDERLRVERQISVVLEEPGVCQHGVPHSDRCEQPDCNGPVRS